MEIREGSPASRQTDCTRAPAGWDPQAEYDALIRRVVRTSTAAVFAYRWGEAIYPTVVAEVDGVQWLVMLSLDGIMETAFPPDDPETYLAAPYFHKLGILEELGL